MFYGEYEYKIDEKGRIPVPPRFRNNFKDGVVLTPGAERCITIYTLLDWKKLSTELTGSALGRSKMRKLNRVLFSTAFTTRIDNQGRIPIPAPLREHAGIGEDAVIAGANTYMEIWDKVTWEAEKQDSQDQAWQIIESLEKT
jgi:MraZ protein